MRRLLFATLFVSFVGILGHSADEPTAFRPSQRKLAIEQKLDSPLKWEPGDREHVTLAELIEHVRDEHQLQIRWDVGSLGLMFGDQAPFAEFVPVSLARRGQDPVQCQPVRLATNPDISPPVVNSGKTQPQPFNPYPAPMAPTVAGAPLYSGGGYAVPNQTPVPQTPVAGGPVAAPVTAAPLTATPASNVLAAQPSATYAAHDQVATGVPAKPTIDESTPNNDASSGPEAVIAKYLTSPISLAAVSLERATVREALRQLLDAVSVPTAAIPLHMGLPVTTRALDLELLIDANSVLITTQLRANAVKETRVYRLGSLGEMPPETLVRVITHSVRPWSWRGQANEIAEQLASRWPQTSIPLPKLNLDLTDGIKLTSAEEGSGEALSADAMPQLSGETVAATGQLLAGGAVATVHSIVAALEIMHHGDPPTGVIESLPGMLVITQSQAAHREIQLLLDELGEGK